MANAIGTAELVFADVDKNIDDIDQTGSQSGFD